MVETLPDGFNYVDESVSPATVRATAEGQGVTFSLLGENLTFSYAMTVSNTAGEYSLSGLLKDVDRVEYQVEGESGVNVLTTSGTRANRSFANASVNVGAQVRVTISAAEYGSAGQVVETLPDGFSFVADSVALSTVRATVDVQDVTFTILGSDATFTYSVTASSAAGEYTFSGLLKDEDTVEYQVGGDSSVMVSVAPPPRPSRPRAPASRNRAPSFEEGSSATRSVAENSAAGTAVGEPVTAADRDDDDIAYSFSQRRHGAV